MDCPLDRAVIDHDIMKIGMIENATMIFPALVREILPSFT